MAEKLEITIEAHDKASSAIGDIHKGLGGLGTLAAGGLAAGAALGAAAIGGLALGLTDMVKGAADAQAIQEQLNAVLESTGGVSGMTAESVNALATDLSRLTRYEDDSIVEGENMLLTFTNIGKKVFPDATRAVLDMSTATGQSLKSSALQLGKALNDPIQGVSALTRVGVTFSEEQRRMIESMVKGGDTAGAQRVILAELRKEFGGSAEAAGKTFAGQLDRLKNSFGNVKDQIGAAFLPALQRVADKLLAVFDKPEVKKAISDIAEWLSERLPIAVDRVVAFIKNPLIPAFRDAYEFIREKVIPVVSDIATWLAENVPQAITTVSGAFTWLKTNVIEPIVTAFNTVIGVIDTVIQWFRDLNTAWQNMECPKWLQMHSPSQLEQALRGVADAAHEVSGIEMPALSVALHGLNGGGVSNTYNNYHTLNVSTAATSGTYLQDYGLLRALAGA